MQLLPTEIRAPQNKVSAGGDKFGYDGNARSLAALLVETKYLLNSVISDTKQGENS